MDQVSNELINKLESRIISLETKMTRIEKAHRKMKKEMTPESERKPRQPSGFAKPTYISPEMCNFLGVETGTEFARTEVTKRVLQYVKDNELQNKETKRIIDVDDKLRILLSPPEGESVTYFNIQRMLKVHYIKPVTADETVATVVEPTVVEPTVHENIDVKVKPVKRTKK
jgi:chromatin remodeling complex protein RSC6